MLRGPLLDADIVDTFNERLISRQLEGIVCKCGNGLAGRPQRLLKKDEVNKVEIAMMDFPYAFSLQGLRGCRWGYGGVMRIGSIRSASR